MKDLKEYSKENLVAIMINMVRRAVNRTRKTNLPYIPVHKKDEKKGASKKNEDKRKRIQ